MGRTNFVREFSLRDLEEENSIESVLTEIQNTGVEAIRLSFPDQHGILRGKTLVSNELPQALKNGCTSTTTLLAKDTSHRTVFPVFSPGGGFNIPEMGNAGDFIMVPLPSTFRILPWARKTGWMLCDIYLSNGEPVPFSTRELLKQSLEKLNKLGFDYLVGLELEMHIYRLKDSKLEPRHGTQPATPPDVELLAHGFHYLTEIRMDEFDDILEIIRGTLKELKLPLRTMEVEFGPSQLELTFKPTIGLDAADNMMLVRSAIKQVCRRHGYHATFMCRPGLENAFASGWHLHQSLLLSSDGSNAFTPKNNNKILSPNGLSFIAGILKNAKESAVLTTPTINGYKRYKPNSLAPNRIVWGKDNKGAMLRVVSSGQNDPATHIENRVGEPAANPYLYLSSQILSGLDGIKNELDPPPPTDDPYAVDAEFLPKHLIEALEFFRKSKFYREEIGDQFVDYFVHLKQAEIDRFFSEVTDWEHKEYFEIY